MFMIYHVYASDNFTFRFMFDKGDKEAPLWVSWDEWNWLCTGMKAIEFTDHNEMIDSLILYSMIVNMQNDIGRELTWDEMKELYKVSRNRVIAILERRVGPGIPPSSGLC